MPDSVARWTSRSSFWLSGILLAALLVGSWFFIDFVARTGERLERQRVQSLSVTAAASLDPELVAALKGIPSEAGTADFEALRVQLKRIHDVNPDMRFVYLMRPRPDNPQQMLFLADAEPSNSSDYSAPGDAYDGPSGELFSVYRTGRPAIQDPYRDRWGYWLTVVSPIKDAQSGAVVAVLGMDISAESWIANMARYRAFAIIISGLAFALVLLFMIGLQLQRRATARIAVINDRLEHQIGELERAQEGLRLADLVVTHTGEGILVLDADFLIKSANPGFERITGFSADELLGRTPPMLAPHEGEVDSIQLIRTHLMASDNWEGTLWARRSTGEAFPLEISVAAVRDKADAVTHHVMVFHDVTAQKQLEERLRELSATDGLTLVANRRSFDEFLEREWHRAMRSNEPVSLIMADIDLFKLYNDTYGHVAGDECLRRVATAISDSCRRRGDLVARYGGEEFAVVLPRTDEGSARAIAEKIRQSVEALGIAHSGNPATGRVTISLGISTRTPPQTEDYISLMQGADVALYRAKDSGRNNVHS